MTLHAGDRLGAYEILAPLGSGGMGEVWRARDTRLGRDVAIKVLPDSLTADPVARLRFDREARAVAALSHPNILDIHDVGTDGGIAWAVTELLEGQTLKTRLDEGALPWRRAVEVALALAEGLEAAHARGVVHRDVKPSNVFLTSDGRVKILDFGIATLDDSASRSQGPRDVTEPHAIVGTAGYLSPEQIRHETADARSDIFALGCVLYEMVTGRRTFPGDTAPEALVATLRGDPRDPADLVTGLPPELRRLILRCLEKRPDRRFQTAADLAFALKIPFTGSGAAHEFVSATDETEVIAPAPAARPKPRVASWVAGGALFAAVLAAAAWLLFFRGSAPAADALAVLPFANETGDPSHDYVSEGVTGSLIDALSKTPGLSVMARSTVYAPSLKGKDPRAAGRYLHTRTVLVGRVRRQGGDLDVDAELVEVASGAQLWSGHVVDRAGDPVPAAADLSPRIARVLKPALTAEEEKRVAGQPHDAQAWDLTLRGRYFLNRRRDEDIGRSLDLFKQALARDPNEAAAWLGLADVFNLLGYYGVEAPRDVIPKQRDAAARAIAIDPSLSGAHSSLADVLYQYEGDFPGAEREFRQALALNPNDAQAHQWYSNFLSASSRFEESFVEIRKARDLDPLSVTINLDFGLAAYWAGDATRALPELRRALELDPTLPMVHLYMGLVLFRTGSHEQAIAEWAKAVDLSERNPDALAFWGYGCALTGRTSEAEAALKELDSLSRKRFVSALPFAILNLGFERKTEALAWLEKACDERAGRLVYLNVERGFDPLRNDPRFVEIVRRLGIPKPH